MKSIEVTQDGALWQAFVNTVINLWIPQQEFLDQLNA
jgi:hypothetical protein